MPGQQCILVGERDGARRRAIADVLCREGYEVWEVNNGRQLLGHIEYLAATRGIRQKPSQITAGSFAVIASPDLEELTLDQVREILRSAEWSVPVITLPAREDAEVGALPALVRENLAR